MNDNKRPFCPSGVFYHIYVPFFRDSDGDGIGDLNGVTQVLDYLAGLGIRGIWLSPIHPSPHYHKYDVLNYYAVAPEYGTINDFERLTREAAKRGITVLMDMVFNCTSEYHPAFLKACADPASPEARMFWFADAEDAALLDRSVRWNELEPWRKTADGREYIGLYSSVMPDLNFNCPLVREECKRIARFWLEKGAGGFRLDSAMHLYSVAEVEKGLSYHAKNVEWWAEFRDFCRSVRPDCYLVGEVWDTPAVRALYYRGLDSSFHFNLGNDIADFLHGELPSVMLNRRLENAYLCAKLADETYTDSPFLSNHDMARFADRLCPEPALQKMAAAIYLTLEGTPFVYYGEELGMRPAADDYCPDYGPDDEFGRSRTAFDWGERSITCATQFKNGYLSPDLQAQRRDRTSMYAFYRRMIALRNGSRALTLGRWSPLPCEADGVLSYRMTYGAETAVVFHNASDVPMPFPKAYAPYVYRDPMISGRARYSCAKRPLPPHHSAVLLQ